MKPWKKIAAGTVLAAVVVGGGVAAVSAASAASNNGSAQSGQPGGGRMDGSGYGTQGMVPGGVGGRGGAFAVSGALHGQFVVATESGGTETEQLQNGSVTASSSGSLTVGSSDGFSATYVIGSGVDVSAIAVGDTVRVLATVDGSTLTATSVLSGAAANAGAAGREGTGPQGGTPPQAAPGGNQQAPQAS